LTEPRPQPENDETSTAQTIGRMTQYAREDAGHPLVQLATQEAAMAAAGDPRGVARTIHRWIRDRFQFVDDSELVAGLTDDPEDAEVLIRPRDLLAMPVMMGDCDDATMLAISMLEAAGIPAFIATVATDPDSPATYTHVYAVAVPQGNYFPLDCSTQRGIPDVAGWEATAAGKKKLWPAVPPKESNMLRVPRYRLGRLGDDSGDGTDWGDVLSTSLTSGLTSAESILSKRYGVPQLNPGQYIKSGNTIMSQAGTGGSANMLGTSGNTGTLLMLGLGALLVVAIVGMRGGR
jgi:hypothetical protein